MSSSMPESSQPVPSEGPSGAGKDERMWAGFCHLAGFASVVGPLVIWLIKKDAFPLVDDQGKEALNFQLNILIYAAISFAFLWLCCVGAVLLLAVAIYTIVLIVIATIQANQGIRYRYPATIRFIP